LIYFIGQNIHLNSLALHEKWWNSAMTGYLTWLASGGFHAPIVEEVKIAHSSEEKVVLQPAPKAKASKGKAKAAKEAKESSLRLFETSEHS
jgi:hypothetical protein